MCSVLMMSQNEADKERVLSKFGFFLQVGPTSFDVPKYVIFCLIVMSNIIVRLKNCVNVENYLTQIPLLKLKSFYLLSSSSSSCL